MTTISNVKVYDLEESVIAARNAMRLTPPEYTDEEFNKSLERAVKLTDSGIITGISCHSNYLVGIRVSFDITYPRCTGCVKWTFQSVRTNTLTLRL